MAILHFQNPDLLITALTHRSALNEHLSGSSESYERLEFLGDAVLELLTSDFLYKRLRTAQEGELTALRSALVKTTTLAQTAHRLGLADQIKMSRGEEKSGGRENPSILADVFEAVVGGLFLDQGLSAVDEFLNQELFGQLDQIMAQNAHKDAKSTLQELAQSRGWGTPIYQLVSACGPDHDREFVIEVLVGGRPSGQGRGKSKQEAQQAAALLAVENLSKHLI